MLIENGELGGGVNLTKVNLNVKKEDNYKALNK